MNLGPCEILVTEDWFNFDSYRFMSLSFMNGTYLYCGKRIERLEDIGFFRYLLKLPIRERQRYFCHSASVGYVAFSNKYQENCLLFLVKTSESAKEVTILPSEVQDEIDRFGSSPSLSFSNATFALDREYANISAGAEDLDIRYRVTSSTDEVLHSFLFDASHINEMDMNNILDIVFSHREVQIEQTM